MRSLLEYESYAYKTVNKKVAFFSNGLKAIPIKLEDSCGNRLYDLRLLRNTVEPERERNMDSYSTNRWARNFLDCRHAYLPISPVMAETHN